MLTPTNSLMSEVYQRGAEGRGERGGVRGEGRGERERERGWIRAERPIIPSIPRCDSNTMILYLLKEINISISK